MTVLASAASILLGRAVLSNPAHVARQRISNPTRYQLEILASSRSDHSLSLVTIIGAGETADATEFLDRGQHWILHVRGSGFDAPPIELNRCQFINDAVTYRVPIEVDEEITNARQRGDEAAAHLDGSALGVVLNAVQRDPKVRARADSADPANRGRR